MKSLFLTSLVCLCAYSMAQTTLNINSGSHTYESLDNYIVNISGSSELHLNGSDPIPGGTIINLNSEDSWVYFHGVNPLIIDSVLRSQVFVDGDSAKIDVNMRLEQYETGGVIIPHDPEYPGIQIFSGTNFSGSAMSFKSYDYNGVAELESLNNAISSFVLKKGYMATIAQEEDGTGYSKNYVANEGDVEVAVLPDALNNEVSYVRVIPWNWPTKKGFTYESGAQLLNATWIYNWGSGATSSLDVEFVPMKWGGGDAGDNFTEKVNSTHFLAYNEPSHSEQSNLSVEEAIKWYPSLLKSGLRAGSPGIADDGRGWLYDFIERCDELNYRVDFVAVHWYHGGETANQMYNWLKEVHDRTGRPVWITEWNNGANWTCCLPTYEEQAEDVADFIYMMDTTSWIERYAIYNWVQAERAVISDGELTLAGEVYRDKVSPLAYNPNKQFDQAYVELPEPIALSAEFASGGIALTWRQNVYGEDGFKIERSANGGDFIEIATIGEQNTMEVEFVDYPSNGGAYSYRVRAYNGSNYSDYSNTTTLAISSGTDLLHMGQITVGMPSGDSWIGVSFGADSMLYEPVVIMGPPSYNGGDPTTIRLRNVSKTGFEFKLDEWGYLDGRHNNAETVSFIALLPGSHSFGGITAVAFNQDGVDENWDALDYNNFNFSAPPTVLATQISNVGSATTAIRLQDVTSSGFEIRLQEQESDDGSHYDETISILALSQGTGYLDGHSISVGLTGATYTHEFSSINFGTTYNDPGFLANMQTFNGGDPSSLRYQNLTSSSVEVKVEEEQSNDDEVNHNYAEAIGWLSIEGINDSQSTSSSRESSSIPQGVQQPEASGKIVLYPNPAQNALHISGIKIGSPIVVYNTLGQIMLEEAYNGQVDLEHLKQGMYIIQLANEQLYKFVKE